MNSLHSKQLQMEEHFNDVFICPGQLHVPSLVSPRELNSSLDFPQSIALHYSVSSDDDATCIYAYIGRWCKKRRRKELIQLSLKFSSMHCNELFRQPNQISLPHFWWTLSDHFQIELMFVHDNHNNGGGAVKTYETVPCWAASLFHNSPSPMGTPHDLVLFNAKH